MTITTIPPELLQKFRKDLLSIPTPKLCDDAETLWKIYKLLEKKISTLKYQKDIRKYLQLQQIFLVLYERITLKEKELEAKKGTKHWFPFYYISFADRSKSEIFRILRRGSLSFPFKLRTNSEIY